MCLCIHARMQSIRVNSFILLIQKCVRRPFKWVLRCYVGGNVRGEYPRGKCPGGNVGGEMSGRKCLGGNVLDPNKRMDCLIDRCTLFRTLKSLALAFHRFISRLYTDQTRLSLSRPINKLSVVNTWSMHIHLIRRFIWCLFKYSEALNLL